LEHDISLFTYHIPLDAHQELGNNWPSAKLLGWTDLEPFGQHHGEMIGVKGRCPSMSREEFRCGLEAFYGRDAQVVFAGPRTIKTCALISGGAHKWIDEAIKDEIDCFVTGTSDEPIWHIAHEEKINFMALGHAATEKIGVQLLGSHLAEYFNLSHHFIDDNNPF
ncbi:MAG: Nif3-like dinuclear metal center hexameric protein, partial [Verrucomicrobia bacterium]|nr:Nif3-like dinuclear metal center hexameric protein [Verrucomicrobiota bacterium]